MKIRADASNRVSVRWRAVCAATVTLMLVSVWGVRTAASTLTGAPPMGELALQDEVWHALGSGLDLAVQDITIVGTDVYVAGGLTDAGGDPDADYFARWDGSSWHAVAGGLTRWVTAIAASGSDIIVGGDFRDAGGNLDADRIARWDGSVWHSLGSGLIDEVHGVAVLGSNVYAGGRFVRAGGNTNANYIARWGEAGDLIFLPLVQRN